MKRTLREIRKSKNLTQREVAKKLGICKRTLIRYENGETKPEIPTLMDILDLYSIKLSDIKFINKWEEILK